MKRLLHVILFIYISVQSVFSDSNDCAAPNFATSLNEYTLCQDGFTDYTIEVEQTNNVPVDEMKWYSKNRVGNNWTEIAGENGNTLTLGTPSDTTFYLFLASNGDCVSDSIIFQLNVVPKPVLAPSYDTVVCKGSSFDIKCPCIEGIATMYEWNEIPSISAVYGIAEIDKDYTFKIFAKHDVCTSEERTINIKIEDPIEITMEEIPSSLCINDEFTFKANVTSGTVDAYHWFVDGVEVFSGSNEFTYTPTQKAKYQLVVDGPICPSVSSPEYDLNVTFDLKVTLEAATPVVCEGNGPRFNPKSNIPSTMRSNLVWEKSMDGVNFEQNLVITDSCPYIYYRIKERVDDRCQWSYSEIVPIKVERRNKSVIKMEPTAICHGDEVHLEAEMETNEFTEYAWYKNGNEISKNNLTLTDTPNDDVTTYEFKVKGDACPTSSSQVTVHMADNTVPIIKEYPSTICEGDSITLEAVDFTANRLYAWVKNRKDTLSNSMTMTDYPTEETTYEFIATGGNCTSMNVPATVNVTHMERPTIDAPGSVCAETPFTIEARIGEGNTGDFIWVKNSTDTIDSSGLTFSDSIDKTTTYQFIATGGICPAKSEPVTIENLYGWEMRLADVPSVICEGESVTLEPMYDISTTKFAWLKDGTDTLSKEEQTLVVSPTKKSSYQVIDLENPCPSGSEIVTIDVITAKETILKDFPETICLGSTVEIEADLATDESNQYAWLKNGTDTIAIGETKLVDSPTETSTYQFISSIPCISNSQVATVKVVSTETPVINAPSIVNEGASVMLEVTSPIEPGSIYAWVKNGSDTIARGKTIITDTPTETSTYEFIITQGSCQNKSNTVTIEVESEEPPVPSDTTVICEGGSVTFTASTFLASNSQIIWLRNGKDTIATDIESFKYSPTITASYQFIVVTGSQKRKSNIEVVKVIPNEKPIIQDAPSLICEGNSITLVTDALVYPNWSYAWLRNGTDTLARSELTLTDLPTGKSTYQFVRGEKCPNKSDIVTIDVTPNEKPVIKETPSSICEGNSVTLEADASVDPNGFYGWVKNGTDTLGKGEMTLTVTPTEETSFQFVRGGSCPNQSDIVTIDVTPNEKPVIKETPSIVCEGGSVSLEAKTAGTPNNDYVWVKNSKDTLTRGVLQMTDVPTETSTYQFVIGGECPNQSEVVTIDVAKKVGLQIATEDSVVCRGENVDITMVTKERIRSGVSPMVEILWEGNGNFEKQEEMESITSDFTIPNVTRPITIRLAIREDVCPDTLSNILHVEVDTPNKDIKLDSVNICEGESATLHARGLNKFTKITWITADDDTLSDQGTEIIVTPQGTTEYQVIVENGVCLDEASAEVKVHAKPTILSCDAINYNTYYVNAEAASNPLTYHYGGKESDSDTLTNLVMGTTYLVEVIDAEGCIDTLSFTVPTYGIEIPEYFVADRETWKIKGIENFEQSSYKIFDRWGKFLFEGEATDDGWDGAYNGHDLPSTDYWYIINIPEIKHVFKGHFTLIRSGK